MSFSPSSGVPTFSSTMTINVGSNVPAGTYVITVKGTGADGKERTSAFVLTVTAPPPPPGDFSVSVSPDSGSVTQGGSTSATVTITSVGDFSETVSLSASGLPSGATATFTPLSGTPSFASQIEISTISTTPAGTYTITITGTGGGKTHSCTYEFTVMSAVPIPPEIVENESPPVEIPFIDPEVPQEVTVENTNIMGLTIDTLEAAENVRIVAQQLTDRPADIAMSAPGAVYQYFNIVVENLSDSQIESVTIQFKVETSWIAQNEIDVQTITLNRYNPVTDEWTPLPTTFLYEDDTYAYFSAISPGLSVFGISGQTITPSPTPPPPIVPTFPMPVFYGLLTMFGALGGGVVVYIRWFRPIKPVISLKRLKLVSPLTSFKRLRKLTWPAISIGHLTPAPMTLAPALPTGPIRPIPIVKRRLQIRLKKVVPITMTPTEILKSLERAPALPRPEIPIKHLEQIKRPFELGVPLEDLRRVVRPPKPSVSLKELAKIARPITPGISLKRLEQVVRPVEPSIPLRRPKEEVKSVAKTRAYSDKRPVEKVPEFLDRLRGAVFGKKRRGEKEQA